METPMLNTTNSNEVVYNMCQDGGSRGFIKSIEATSTRRHQTASTARFLKLDMRLMTTWPVFVALTVEAGIY